jgi:hypothetical protein
MSVRQGSASVSDQRARRGGVKAQGYKITIRIKDLEESKVALGKEGGRLGKGPHERQFPAHRHIRRGDRAGGVVDLDKTAEIARR